MILLFFFQAEDGIRDIGVTGVQTCALPISSRQSNSGLAMMVLANMEFDWRDATVLFVLWLVQFLQPGLREVVAIAYAVWMVILAIEFAVGRKALLAPKYFWEIIRRKRDRPEPL